MLERQVTLLAIAAAVVIPQATRAQVSSRVEVGALSSGSSTDAVPAASVFRVSPTARYDRRYVALDGATSAWMHDGQWLVADGTVNAVLTAPTFRHIRAELRANASRAFEERSLGTDHLDVQTRVNFLIKERAGVWVGGGTARPWRVAVISAVDVLNGGFWITAGDRTVSSTVTRYNFTKASVRRVINGVPTCGSRILSHQEAAFGVDGCRQQTRVTDLDMAAKWKFLGVEYGGEAGYRVGKPADVSADSRAWASITATRWVAPRAAIVVGGGRQPENPSRGIPARTFASVGMAFSYLPVRLPPAPVIPRFTTVTSFDLHEIAVGKQQVIVRMGSVSRVDVAGDFSEWEPVAFTRRPGTDIWEVQLSLPPGAHHINIRVDNGRWVVPPGLPALKDGFGGEVGLLVIEKK